MGKLFTVGKYTPSCTFQAIPWSSDVFLVQSEGKEEEERLNELQEKLPNLKVSATVRMFSLSLKKPLHKGITQALKKFGRQQSHNISPTEHPDSRTSRIHEWMESIDSSFSSLRSSCGTLASTTLVRYRILDVAADFVNHQAGAAHSGGGVQTASSIAAKNSNDTPDHSENQESLSPSKHKIFSALMDGQSMEQLLESLVVRSTLFLGASEDTAPQQIEVNRELIDSAVRHDRKSDYHKVLYNFEMAACVLKCLMDSVSLVEHLFGYNY